MGRKPKWEVKPAPGENDGVFIPIVSPGAGKTVWGVILSERIHGYDVHYLGERTRPCTGNPVTCEGCQLTMPKRWKGWLPVWLAPQKSYGIAELTPYAVKHCPALIAPDANLVGKVLQLYREGPRPNGKVLAKLQEPKGVKLDDLPPCFDLVAALERVFDAPNRRSRLRSMSDPAAADTPEDLLPLPTVDEVREMTRRLRGEAEQ